MTIDATVNGDLSSLFHIHSNLSRRDYKKTTIAEQTLPFMKTKLRLLPILALTAQLCLAANNVANPKEHPYADPTFGREDYQLSGQTVNETRLYKFYQRQADYYMANPDKMPDILPSYPGLDAGKFGHWGKHNQNNHNDGRWNEIELGEHQTLVFKPDGVSILKGICVRLGDKREMSACFDPMTLTYRALWEGGFLEFQPFRWGTSRNVERIGKSWFTVKDAQMPDGGVYKGFHRYGKRIVFEYEIGGQDITDEPWAAANAFYRRLDVEGSPVAVPFNIGEGQQVAVISGDGKVNGQTLTFQGTVVVRISATNSPAGEEKILEHLASVRKPVRRWKEVLAVPGTFGKPKRESAYAVDNLNVPYDNPYKTVMQLTGIAFLENGDALVCTLPGDVWLVSGISGDLKEVTWRRFATGFNQPVGIHIDDDGVFILDRGQIYRIHDTNNDGEADYYENYANDFGGYNQSHSHTFGLHRTSNGSFHFTQRENILRTGTERETEMQAWGVRNCMGIGGSEDYFWVAPQEGTWTPASAIIEVHQGEFYGHPSKEGKGGTITAPLCFIPRGIDNSTGGMLEITSNKWGPVQGAHVGLSYGAGLHYLILRDDQGSRPQGAVVPMEGEFLSGSMRGAFHPQDGQLYLVGMDGWGDYSVKDGCFHRVRYTGKPVYKPKGLQVHTNGLRIDFTAKLDKGVVTKAGNYFAQAWNYEYANRYGSPEFSTKEPTSLGHDPIEIRSVKLLDDDSIFVEMPAMEPVMQLYLRMHLKAADGHSFQSDLFASPMFPSGHFKADGLAKPRKDKPDAIALRVSTPKEELNSPITTGTPIKDAREISIEAIAGLQYSTRLIEVKAGEALAWKLRNTDVMPHNLVLAEQGAIQVVGDASFKMLSDPESGKKNYVPDLTEVLGFIPVINPGKEHTFYFRAPKETGDYPYLCTFPGHWKAMNGILRVR
jgi:azurin